MRARFKKCQIQQISQNQHLNIDKNIPNFNYLRESFTGFQVHNFFDTINQQQSINKSININQINNKQYQNDQQMLHYQKNHQNLHKLQDFSQLRKSDFKIFYSQIQNQSFLNRNKNINTKKQNKTYKNLFTQESFNLNMRENKSQNYECKKNNKTVQINHYNDKLTQLYNDNLKINNNNQNINNNNINLNNKNITLSNKNILDYIFQNPIQQNLEKNRTKQRLSQLKQLINQMTIQASKTPKIINAIQLDQKSQKQTRLTVSTDTFVSVSQSNPENEQKQCNSFRRHLSQSKIEQYDKQSQEQEVQICPKMRKSQTTYQVLKPISNQNNKKMSITSHNSNTISQQALSISDFKLIKLIGKGSYGKIHLACHILTNTLYAIKIIPKRVILKQNHLAQFIQECKNLSMLDHPNITKLYTVFHDYTKIYMLMQYCPDGSLEDHINNNKSKKQMNCIQQKKLIKQLVSAVSYMHYNNVIHRDIKLQNVLISYQQIKLCDFGCSKYYNNQSQLKQTNYGTFIYKSPEQIKKLSYDHKADIWSLGITIYQLVTGKMPYQIDYAQTLTQTILLKHMQNIEYPENLNENLKELLKQMLKLNPKQRIDARSILTA